MSGNRIESSLTTRFLGRYWRKDADRRGGYRLQAEDDAHTFEFRQKPTFLKANLGYLIVLKLKTCFSKRI